MSTAPAAVAGAPAAPAAGTAAPDTSKTVPSDIRRRVLSGIKTPPPPTSDEIEAKKKSDQDAADKKTREDKAAEDKKKSDEAAARAAGVPPADRARKVKAGPPLPEKPSAAAADPNAVRAAVREAIADNAREAAAGAGTTLKPEDAAEVELARFAEKKNPERYAGFADKVTNFYTSHDQHRAAKASELGGVSSPEFKDYLESDEYKSWVKENRPAYARGDREKLREDAISDRAREDAKRELAPKLKELERQTSQLKHGPAIKAKVNEVLNIVITDPGEQKDAALVAFAKDPVKFGEEHPDEAQIIAAEAEAAMELVEEVYKIDLDLVEFNPRAPTPKQAEIRKFTRAQNAALRGQNPNGMEMSDGKILIDADTFHERGLDKDGRYRVFTADEIAGMLAATRNAIVLDKLKRRREGITKSVYAPKQVAAEAPPSSQATGATEDPPAPGAGTSAAPGTAVKAKENKSLARRYA